MTLQIIKNIDIWIYAKLEPIWNNLSEEAQDSIMSLLYSKSEFEEILLERALTNYPNFGEMLVQKIKIEKQKVLNEIEEKDRKEDINNLTKEIL